MANQNKRIVDLPLILSGDVSSLDVLPIVNIETDITNKITIQQLSALFSNDTNYYLTGGSYNSITESINFNGNNPVTNFSVDLSSIVTDDITITGGTYDSTTGVVTFYNNSGGTFQVSGFLTGYTNFYTTGATLVGATLEFDRTDLLNAYSVDLSPLKFTGNTSGDCINDIFVSNIHSCSPLYINPNDEGDIYFGSNSGVTIDLINEKIKTTSLQVTSGATNGYVLTSDSDGNAIWQELITGTDLGNVLFVSTNGNDSTAVKGDLNKPYANIYAAKSAATSGDLIYIFPGTWTFDNRNSTGNQYNGQIETKINLWKNGVSYYFSQGSKIVFYNQTNTGQVMYLFSPTGTIGETCKIYGDLEWEGNSTGPDTSLGHVTFFWLDNSNDSGFTFHAEFKKLTSYANEPIRVSRNVTLIDSYPASITLIGDEIYRQYLGGQSGAAAVEFYNGSNAILNIESRVRKRTNVNSFWYFQINGNQSRSYLNIFGDLLYHSGGSRAFWLRDLTGTINIDIKKMYHGTGNVFETFGSGGWTLNLKGDVIDNVKYGSSTGGVFWITSGGNTINFDGNVSTNIGSGAGRYVAAGTSTNTYNLKGDINFLGTGITTNVIFYTQNGGIVNYSGKISGNYSGGVAQTLNGTININNSYIKSSVESSSARLFFNGTTSQGYFRLNNSYVELKNNTNPLSNGSYIDSFINNSTIINTGSGNTLSNTTNFGKMQTLNSTIISSYSGATSITSTGTAPVISSNSTVNTPYNIVDLKGNITILTDLIY